MPGQEVFILCENDALMLKGEGQDDIIVGLAQPGLLHGDNVYTTYPQAVCHGKRDMLVHQELDSSGHRVFAERAKVWPDAWIRLAPDRRG